jgi:N-acetylglutamate synthase-like GNAT family acetyltransferase
MSTPATPLVRFAQHVDDLDSLTHMINEAFTVGEKGIIVEPFQRVTHEEVREMALKQNLLVLVDECLKLQGCINVFGDNTVGELFCLAVSKVCQGKGYGRQIMLVAEDLLRSKGCVTVQLKLLSPTHWKHAHKERLRSWYTERLGYSLLKESYASATTKMPKGAMFANRIVLATDADLTVYKKNL